jgi:hypothetical protein
VAVSPFIIHQPPFPYSFSSSLCSPSTHPLLNLFFRIIVDSTIAKMGIQTKDKHEEVQMSQDDNVKDLVAAMSVILKRTKSQG